RFVDCGLQCGSEHFVCQACVSGGDGNGGTNKRCGPCGHAVSYTRSRFMDGVVDAYKVSCLYKGHGCAMDGIPYHSAADHKASCKHAPCYCFDCRFVGSPAKLVRHLASPSGAHAWPVEKISCAESCIVPASSLLGAELLADHPRPTARRGLRLHCKKSVRLVRQRRRVSGDQGPGASRAIHRQGRNARWRSQQQFLLTTAVCFSVGVGRGDISNLRNYVGDYG
uniref:SIAH-type domain-containing protein n=1 Tax=Aegilops tauschii subsp. strangulata TaxID=200361 RepID=A0A453R7I4_AEGTS